MESAIGTAPSIAADDFMLTTTDNPFNPWIDFDTWYAEDIRLGHDTCGYLDRVMTGSSALTQGENDVSYNDACNDIIRLDPTGLYTKIKKPGK